MEVVATASAIVPSMITYRDDMHTALFKEIRFIRKMKHPVERKDGELIQHISAKKYLSRFKPSYSTKLNRSMIPDERGIYLIYCAQSRRCYVGKSGEMLTRMAQHEYHLKTNAHVNPHLQNAYNLYSGQTFIVYPLEIVSKEEDLAEREAYWATVYDVFRTGYNIAPINADGLSVGNGRFNRGERNGGAKLAEGQVIEICEHLNQGQLSLVDIAKKYGVSSSLIMTIKDGKKWTHITKEHLNYEDLIRKKRIVKRLSSFELIEICMRLNRNEPVIEIAQRFGVTKQTIYLMRLGQKNRHIGEKYLSQRFIKEWNVI